ncbi:transcriptional regulator with XRE-family HTH domain [Pelomonas saccharophila]|uniref:Transcriptional regulator with XRE-family HTH domain n=1 Tax=Roseateles saccharophilus TaxID=304 RepID=A0ABU1YN19_ROSSA|nr:helix-turn-helix transcriptional regulator [Roseateles saccharophilus]MDR7270118.1 transcriptional regulator with XRE-family HTH domain [Roseateles saccharophilus]
MNTLSAFTPDELIAKLGEDIARLRLDKNITQLEVARRAGVSRTAVVNLETGRGATLYTLVRVLRVLGREDWLGALAPRVTVRPLELRRLGHGRQRASSKGSGD